MLKVKVSDGYYWTLDMTPQNAANYLAERSQHVSLHVEPVAMDGNDTQNEIRRLYFEAVEKKEGTK